MTDPFAINTMKVTRLLILEKNRKVRSALAARLGSSPHIEVVGTAATADEGMHLLGDREVDVVVLDAKSTGRGNDLTEVIGQLRERHFQVIVLTSYSVERERRSALKSGAQGYLLKDIDSQTLIGMIEGR